MTILRWIPWVLLVGLPLLAVPDMPDMYGPVRWMLLAFVAVGCWAWTRKHWGEVVGSVGRWTLVAILVFTGMGLLSMAVALHPLEALWEVLRWIMVMGLVLLLAWAYARWPEWRLEPLRAAAAATALVGGIRLLQLAGVAGGIPDGGDPEASTLANPNFFAGFMALLAVLSAGLALLDRGWWRWAGIAAALLAAGLTLTGSTSGASLALGLAVVVLVEGLLAMGPFRGMHKSLPWLRPVMLGMALLGAAAAIAWVYSRADAVDLNMADVDSKLERLALWNRTGRMIAEAPVLGVGAGHWHYHILRLGLVSNFQGFATRYFMQAHNDFLQMAAERGVIGGLAFLALLGMAWFRGWRAATGGRANLTTVVATAGLTAWMAFALTNLPSARPELVAVMVLCLAMLVGHAPVVKNTDMNRPRWRSLLAGGIALGSLGSLLLLGTWMKGDQDIFRVLDAKGRQDWLRVERTAREATTWYNTHDRVTGTPLLWYQGVALLSSGRSKESIPILLAAQEQHPWHPQVLSNLGTAYAIAGDYPTAAKWLEQALEIFPDFSEVRMNLTELQLMMGQHDKAAASITYWREHSGNPRFDDYYRKITLLLDSLGGK